MTEDKARYTLDFEVTNKSDGRTAEVHLDIYSDGRVRGTVMRPAEPFELLSPEDARRMLDAVTEPFVTVTEDEGFPQMAREIRAFLSGETRDD